MKTLRAEGHDVPTVREVHPGADDGQVIEIALRENRILLTEDKDFGQLAHAHGRHGSCVIFLRYPLAGRTQICRDLADLIRKHGEKLHGCFITIQIGKIRINRMP